jgi:hypothetical protein
MESGNCEPTALTSFEPMPLCEPRRNELLSKVVDDTDGKSGRLSVGIQKGGICKADKAEAGTNVDQEKWLGNNRLSGEKLSMPGTGEGWDQPYLSIFGSTFLTVYVI